MVPKAHLTSHSRMHGSSWVTPLWLSGSLKPILYSASVYSCHLFLILSPSVRFLLLLSFILPILAWNVPFISLIFLKSSLVFLNLLFSLISLHCSFKKAFLSLLATLWNSAFSWVYLSLSPLLFAYPLFSAICKDFTLLSCISFSLGQFWSLPPIQASEPESIVLQTVCQLDLIQWIYLSPPLYNCKGFDMQKSKISVGGGLTNSCEKKRSEKQRRKGEIQTFECRVQKNSKER